MGIGRALDGIGQAASDLVGGIGRAAGDIVGGVGEAMGPALGAVGQFSNNWLYGAPNMQQHNLGMQAKKFDLESTIFEQYIQRAIDPNIPEEIAIASLNKAFQTDMGKKLVNASGLDTSPNNIAQMVRRVRQAREIAYDPAKESLTRRLGPRGESLGATITSRPPSRTTDKPLTLLQKADLSEKRQILAARIDESLDPNSPDTIADRKMYDEMSEALGLLDPYPPLDTEGNKIPSNRLSYSSVGGTGALGGISGSTRGLPNLPTPQDIPGAGSFFRNIDRKSLGLGGTSPYPDYPDAFEENGVWKVIRDGKKFRIIEED